MDMDENKPYYVNFKRVAEQSDFLAITKFLAMRLMDNPYIKVSDFLQQLSNEDLQTLLEISDDEENERLEEVILISEMLAVGEGLDSANAEVSMERTNQFAVFLVLESLKRKGLVKLHYENMSFGEDFKDKVIAEKP